MARSCGSGVRFSRLLWGKVCWSMPLITALEFQVTGLRESEDSQGYMEKVCFKQTNKQTHTVFV